MLLQIPELFVFVAVHYRRGLYVIRRRRYCDDFVMVYVCLYVGGFLGVLPTPR